MRTTRLASLLGIAAIFQFSLGAHAWAQAPGAPPPPANPAPAAAPGAPPPAYAPPPDYAPPPAYPSAAAPQAYPPPPLQQPLAGPVVTLRASAPRARLQQQTQLRWNDVCVAPCGIAVNPTGVYRVGGGTYRGSDPFKMPRSSGPVLLDANVGSNVKHWVGFGMLLGGGIALLSGIALIALSSSVTGQSATDPNVSNSDYFKASGIVYAVIGAIVTGVGIGLYSSGSTSVEIR
jgi:hypothetical protein